MMYLILGTTLLVIVLRDVFHTVVVPRGKISGFRVAPFLVRYFLWPPVRILASLIASPEWKSGVLGMFAPSVLMMLLTVWACLLIFGLGLVSFDLASHYAPPIDSMLSAIFVAGSNFLTLGSADFIPKTATVRFLTLAAAFIGMVLTASVISLMFSLIGSTQRRDVLVSLTTNIALSPPSGIAILETFSREHGFSSLGMFYRDWHIWCADVFETHKAYPILPYFRSSDPFTSWVTALGAVLDSAALLLSAERDDECFSARLMFSFGCRVVADLAEYWNLDTTDVSPAEEIDFHSLYLRLQSAGVCLIDESTAKDNFELLRKEYASTHRALCIYLAVPFTPLSTAPAASLIPARFKRLEDHSG